MSRHSVRGYLRLLSRDNLLRIIAFGVLAVIAAIFAASSSNQPRQGQIGNYNSEQKAASKIKEDGFLGIGPDGWTAIFTGFLTLFTGLLVGTAYIQISYLVRADENARKSADAALKAAAAAENQIKLSRDMFIAENRPWLDLRVEYLGFKFNNQGMISIEFKITLENTGKNPASNVYVNDPGAYMMTEWTKDHFNSIRQATVVYKNYDTAQQRRGLLNIFPGKSEYITHTSYFTKEELNCAIIDGGIIPRGLLPIICFYKYNLTGLVHETSKLYAFGFGHTYMPIPKSPEMATQPFVMELSKVEAT